jgi:serine/threonine protein kinase
MSLENLLVHKGVSLIIDMGMCLKVPYEEDPESQLEQQQQQQPSLPNTNTHANATEDGNTNTNMNNNIQGLIGAFGNVGVNGTNKGQQQHQQQQIQQQQIQQQQQQKMQMETMERNQRRRQRRCMILPQGTCGKWHYMSPEIYQDSAPFDGFAVDMWATGVILFLMLTGFPPWERPCRTDERFKYMTQGYLVQMLTEWNVGLSGDAMDLLQRMLWIDPNDRLSLAQVRAHPWMTNGPLQPPSA